MSKYFVFLYPDKSPLRDFLNLAIYLLNPREKWPAHVTIAGPFRRITELPRSLEFVEQISILGRGRFQNGPRATVFLRVGSRDIGSRIRKPDFPQAIPHLTLYSGSDLELADLLYERLESAKLYGLFHSTHFDVVDTGGQYGFDFKLDIRPELLLETSDKSLERIANLGKSERVELAVKALERGFKASLEAAAAMNIHKKTSFRSLSQLGKAPHPR